MRSRPLDIGAGFTLVELLVAISILAIIAVLGWRGLDEIVWSRDELTADMERARGLQLAFAQLQTDCAQIVAASNLPNRVRLLVKPDGLLLVRTVFADAQPSRVQVVAYRVEDGKLTRRESKETRDLNELDASWKAFAEGTDSNPPVALQSGVATISMRTWTKGEIAWRSVEADVVSTGATPGSVALPEYSGLEVSLQLNGRPDRMIKSFLLGPA